MNKMLRNKHKWGGKRHKHYTFQKIKGKIIEGKINGKLFLVLELGDVILFLKIHKTDSDRILVILALQKFQWNLAQIIKTPSERRTNWRHKTCWLKISHEAVMMKTEWDWNKSKHIDQWNRTESPEINLHKDGQLVFDKKKAKNKEKDSDFSKWYKPDIHVQKKENKPFTYTIHSSK